MTRRWTLCHTADWHLGHALHGRSREAEHAAFFAWLIETLAAREVDALIVAGDVFDSASPSGAAQAQLYAMLAALRARCPEIDVVVIAGNHDSPSRLAAPDPVLRSLGVRVIGHVPWIGKGREAVIDAEALVVPIRAGGEIVAQVGAVPYLRASDLPSDGATDEDAPQVRLARAAKRVYDEVAAAARRAIAAAGDEAAEGERALIVTGHAHVAGAAMSDRSERAVFGGLAGALPPDVFPEDAAYVALGHLHLAQAIDGREHVRYSGSPIPLALGEEGYPHQVRLVTLEGARVIAQEACEVPRAVAILRVPEGGAEPLDRVLERLAALDVPAASEAIDRRAWLEVRVRIARPEPAMRARVDEAIADKAVRLVKLTVEREDAPARVRDEGAVELADLGVRDVFLRRWRASHEGEPPEDVAAAFDEVVARVLDASDAPRARDGGAT